MTISNVDWYFVAKNTRANSLRNVWTWLQFVLAWQTSKLITMTKLLASQSDTPNVINFIYYQPIRIICIWINTQKTDLAYAQMPLSLSLSHKHVKCEILWKFGFEYGLKYIHNTQKQQIASMMIIIIDQLAFMSHWTSIIIIQQYS